MKDLSILNSKVFAHRGLHNDVVMENTMEAFKQAISKKIPIELDVHILKDKTIVVFHDRNLKRLYKKNISIKDLDYKNLSKLTDNKVPKLEEVLKQINGKVPVIVEIKKDSKKYTLEKELVKQLDNYNGLFAVKSFNRRSMYWFKRHRNDYVRGLLVHNRYYSIPDKIKLKYNILRIKPDFLSVNYNLLGKRFIKKYNKKMKILAWTIKSEETFVDYKFLCDGLICENINHLERKLK